MDTAKQSTDKLSAIITSETIPELSIAEVWHRLSSGVKSRLVKGGLANPTGDKSL